MNVLTKAWLVLPLLASLPAGAQWLNYPDPSLPRNPDGTVDLTAPAPRQADGHPDLSGVWHVQPTSLEEWRKMLGDRLDGRIEVPGMEIYTVSKYATNLFIDYPPGEAPIRPEAMEVAKSRGGVTELPSTYCLPLGVPLATLLSEVTKIVHSPGLTLILHEIDGIPRKIYTDGRDFPEELSPTWLGSSIGHWEDDTFVVETRGFNDRSWLDTAAHPRSESMKITERYTRRDVGHMDIEYTFDDPVYYTEPFSLKVTHLLQPDTDILEYVCNENEKDIKHMKDE